MSYSARLLVIIVMLSSSVAAAPPGTQPAGMDQRCRDLLNHWQAAFNDEHFTAVLAPPFVLAGNGTPQQIARYRDATVLAAAAALQATYFKAEPSDPILILLFETEGPYKRLANQWFKDESVPHFGYFRHDNIMLMNVGTGTGTLVHELTHALIKPDFPDVPSWFNEGLASLYEQCSLGRNTIRGHVNWRLPALQKAIEGGTLRTFEELIADPRFYDEARVGLNYAQARYLMLYLQEKGELQAFYTSFRDHVKDDRTGVETLKKIVAPQSMEAFEKTWRDWVMTLKAG